MLYNPNEERKLYFFCHRIPRIRPRLQEINYNENENPFIIDNDENAERAPAGSFLSFFRLVKWPQHSIDYSSQDSTIV